MAFFRKRGTSPRQPKALKIGVTVLPSSLDPVAVQDLATASVVSQIFETAIRSAGPDEPPLSVLFEGPLERSTSPRGSELWTGQIRPGVLFSDGTPLTAERMARSLGETDLPSRARMDPRGDRLSFELARPNPSFPLVLAEPNYGIFRRSGKELVGTGPFQPLSDSEPNVLRLGRNPRFRREVTLDELHFVLLPPNEEGRAVALTEAVEKGEVHLTTALSRREVDRLSDVRKVFQPGDSTAILHFQCEKWSDPQLRRAMALALDRKNLAQRSYENALAFAASGLLPPVFGSLPDRLRHSLRSAKEALESASTRPSRLSMLVIWAPRPYLPHPLRTASAIVEQLAEIGIEVEIVESDSFTAFYDASSRGEHDLILTGWIADTSNRADFLQALLGSRNVPEVGKIPGSNVNHSRFRHAGMDRAIAAYRAGQEAEGEIARILSEEVPLVPLLYGPSVVVHQWSVKGWEPSAFGSHRFVDIDLVEK